MDLSQEVGLEFLGHDGFLINYKDKKIVIDPYNLQKRIDADIILITHGHYDHCSIKDLEKVIKLGSIVVCPADCQSKLLKFEKINLQIIEAGEVLDFGNVKIEAVSAYNINKDFHPKSEGWIGYIVKLDGVVIYHAGDTDYIPEMQKLSGYGKHGNKFVVLLPVSGKYVMDSEEAVDAASIMSPDVAVPMHYGAGVAGTIEDAKRFVELCKERNINAVLLEKI
ncbi:MAG: MBL fold metallo-hydrolase [Candidatus Pacearchaeota archaeon]|nr:MBL fold metallo-hydrolase [Candidatus Pacearchaeota archaeon]